MALGTAVIQAGVNAVLSGQNIGKAMEQALRSTLVSIASEAAVRALYNVGLGIYYDAIHDYPDAELAFHAAEVFGAVAGVAGGIAGALPGGGSRRALGGAAGAGAGAGTYGGGGGGAPAAPQTLAPGAAGAGGRFSGDLHVIVVGQQQAGEWLAGTLNEAVNRGVNLTSTSSQRGSPVGH